MRRSELLFAMLFLSASAFAQKKNDWHTVRDLPAETPINLKLQHHRGFTACWFQQATETNLTCDRADEDPHLVTYSRDEIRKVYRKPEPRLDRPTSPPASLVVAPVVASLIILRLFWTPVGGAIAGGIAGAGILAASLNHGILVYANPKSKPGWHVPVSPSDSPESRFCGEPEVPVAASDR